MKGYSGFFFPEQLTLEQYGLHVVMDWVSTSTKNTEELRAIIDFCPKGAISLTINYVNSLLSN